MRAGDGTMRAEEREFCFGVVEAGYVHPGFCGVAGFAAEGGAVGALAVHAVVEFALVRIGVAGGAATVREVEGQDFVGATGSAELVAFGAGDRGVRGAEGEASAVVLGDGVGGAVEIDDRVAGFAFVVVRRGGELIVVSVLVAVGAGGEFNFVERVFAAGACGDVALGAFHFDVLAL